MNYIPYFVLHQEEFKPYKFTGKYPEGNDWRGDYNNLEPKDNATKEAIQSWYSHLVIVDDPTETIEDNPKELCKRMVQFFKESNCYKAKTEEERQEIIEYLLKTPFEYSFE